MIKELVEASPRRYLEMVEEFGLADTRLKELVDITRANEPVWERNMLRDLS